MSWKKRNKKKKDETFEVNQHKIHRRIFNIDGQIKLIGKYITKKYIPHIFLFTNNLLGDDENARVWKAALEFSSN